MLWLLSWFYQRCQRCCSLSPSVSCGRQTQEGKRWSAAAWSQNPGRFDAGGASLVPARRKVRPPPRGRCWPTPRSDHAHPSASPEVRTQEQKCLCECLDLLQHFSSSPKPSSLHWNNISRRFNVGLTSRAESAWRVLHRELRSGRNNNDTRFHR